MNKLMRISIFLLLFNSFGVEAGCLSFFERIKSIFVAPNISYSPPAELNTAISSFISLKLEHTKNVLFSSPSSKEYSFLLTKAPDGLLTFMSPFKLNINNVRQLKRAIYNRHPKLKDTVVENIFSGLEFEAKFEKGEKTIGDILLPKIEATF